jgi:prefoldin subunit 5
MNSEVGELIDIDTRYEHDDKYVVRFDNIPKTLGSGYIDRDYISSIRFLRSEIKYFSKNKSELEAIIQSKIYNL